MHRVLSCVMLCLAITGLLASCSKTESTDLLTAQPFTVSAASVNPEALLPTAIASISAADSVNGATAGIDSVRLASTLEQLVSNDEGLFVGMEFQFNADSTYKVTKGGTVNEEGRYSRPTPGQLVLQPTGGGPQHIITLDPAAFTAENANGNGVTFTLMNDQDASMVYVKMSLKATVAQQPA